jgi:hypothetical protein
MQDFVHEKLDVSKAALAFLETAVLPHRSKICERVRGHS